MRQDEGTMANITRINLVINLRWRMTKLKVSRNFVLFTKLHAITIFPSKDCLKSGRLEISRRRISFISLVYIVARANLIGRASDSFRDPSPIFPRRISLISGFRGREKQAFARRDSLEIKRKKKKEKRPRASRPLAAGATASQTPRSLISRAVVKHEVDRFVAYAGKASTRRRTVVGERRRNRERETERQKEKRARSPVRLQLLLDRWRPADLPSFSRAILYAAAYPWTKNRSTRITGVSLRREGVPTRGTHGRRIAARSRKRANARSRAIEGESREEEIRIVKRGGRCASAVGSPREQSNTTSASIDEGERKGAMGKETAREREGKGASRREELVPRRRSIGTLNPRGCTRATAYYARFTGAAKILLEERVR